MPFQGLRFMLMGRLKAGKQDDIRDQIPKAGGQLTHNILNVDYLVADTIPTPRWQEVHDFQTNGGKVVSSDWLIRCMKESRLVEEEDDTSTSIADSNAKRKAESDTEQLQTPKKSRVKVTSINAGTKLKTEVKRGDSIPEMIRPQDLLVDIDPIFVAKQGDMYDTVYVDDDIWDCTLNQTSISDNCNKFYLMQIIATIEGEYICYSRWGRVGQAGQTQSQHYLDVDSAKQAFVRKFYDKTRIEWPHRRAQNILDAKKYIWIEKEYARKQPVKLSDRPAEPASSLSEDLQKVLKLICNRETMKLEMDLLGLNSEELPLGKLSAVAISKGHAALNTIAQAVDAQAGWEELMRLCSKFYSVIPHRVPVNARPPLLADKAAIQKKVELLESLEDIRLGTHVLDRADTLQEQVSCTKNTLDMKYEALGCKMTALQRQDEDYGLIERYVQQTHNEALEWASFTIKLEGIFSLSSPHDTRFEPYQFEVNRQLLWHASRLANFTGILSQGLRIAPKEAPSSGYRLGKGIYFTNSLSKATQYCWAASFPSSHCILLCEVALGQQEKRFLDFYVGTESPATGHDSTWGVGRLTTDCNDWGVYKKDVIVPCGRPVAASNHDTTSFDHDEFVVYDPARVRPRFLVMATFEQARL